ncbi:MAG: peptidylprolyl isomerase [Kiritimatiellae bacterium]|nr:peptidylprolyl isomerase [Kiritimatiellia bacterium]
MKTAVVNGTEISTDAIQFELDRLVRFYMSHGMTVDEVRKNLPKLQEKALDQAIGAKLLFDRASQLELPVTAKDVDAEVERVVAQVGGRENYDKALAAQGMTDEAFRKELEKGVRVNMLVNQACAHVDEPTEKEVEEFYAAHKDEYVAQPQVLCQHILVKSEEGDLPEAKSAAFEKIRAIRERVVAGGDFAEEAKKHSDCPSGREGGSLGWFGPGMMVPEFDKAAFGMKKGEVSDIVTTQFGYHIIYKADEKAGGAQTLVDVHDQIKDLLRHEARGRAMDQYVAELRAAATIEFKQAEEHHCSCGHDHGGGHHHHHGDGGCCCGHEH